MAGGFSELHLALFTTLAPAGAVAYACMAAFLLLCARGTYEARARMLHALAFPVAVTWAGFIASAVHLGTPANALHVVTGVGRSPLSNEVAAAVVFLFFSGVCWLYSYRVQSLPAVEKALLAVSGVSALVFVGFTSVAYAVPTVLSWDIWFAPVNLWMSAAVLGFAFASLVMRSAQCRVPAWPWALLVFAALALGAGAVLLFLHAQALEGITNNVNTAALLVPEYGVAIMTHLVLGFAGLSLQWLGFLAMRSSLFRGTLFACAGVLLLAFAAFLVRLPFYASYLPAGF